MYWSFHLRETNGKRISDAFLSVSAKHQFGRWTAQVHEVVIEKNVLSCDVATIEVRFYGERSNAANQRTAEPWPQWLISEVQKELE